jgi:hypothetical protein
MSRRARVWQAAREAKRAESFEPVNIEGPAGTYGCACVSRDALACRALRCGLPLIADPQPCECLCHQWRDEDGNTN